MLYPKTNGGTNFQSLEDVEICPLTGDIYFTSKRSTSPGGVYRFKDNGDGTVSDFKIHLKNNAIVSIKHDGGSQMVNLKSGHDNLTFDNDGNLYVLQDGYQDHIWFLASDHTMNDPKVSVFLRSPKSSEPTGMTFSPDGKYAFLSIQHPSGTSNQKDVLKNNYVWNKSTTIVIARKEYLGGNLNDEIVIEENGVSLSNNDRLEFGNVSLSSPVSKTIKISNTSLSENLAVEFATLSHSRFSLNDNEEKYIKPGEFSEFDLEFETDQSKTFSGSMYLFTSDIKSKSFKIRFRGTGDNTLSINKKEKNNFDVYPNPVSERLYINTSSSLLAEVVDFTGKVISKSQIFGEGSIDVSALKRGVYFLRMNFGGNSQITKFIVE